MHGFEHAMERIGKAEDALGAFMQKIIRPLFIDQMAQLELAGDRTVYPFRCVGIQTDGKAKNFEWMDFGFDVPPALLNDVNGAVHVDKALVSQPVLSSV